MREAIGVTALTGLSLAVRLAFAENAENWEKITDPKRKEEIDHIMDSVHLEE
jgi:hypothetical protein